MSTVYISIRFGRHLLTVYRYPPYWRMHWQWLRLSDTFVRLFPNRALVKVYDFFGYHV
ncbi:hypothetical protein [Burkholderia cenocepacia]|uniref:hypothetical protein n=1 Tax=Burkholderia cenocepacia TaxID=95486 RepID=UPI002ABE8375|nr:hypothetical protein [Burkholderia cenocepacia]